MRSGAAPTTTRRTRVLIAAIVAIVVMVIAPSSAWAHTPIQDGDAPRDPAGFARAVEGRLLAGLGGG